MIQHHVLRQSRPVIPFWEIPPGRCCVCGVRPGKVRAMGLCDECVWNLLKPPPERKSDVYHRQRCMEQQALAHKWNQVRKGREIKEKMKWASNQIESGDDDDRVE